MRIDETERPDVRNTRMRPSAARSLTWLRALSGVMAMALAQGTASFAASKFALTGAGILTLVFLARTYFLKVVRTGLLLTLFFSTYCCLVCYQFVHLLRVL